MRRALAASPDGDGEEMRRELPRDLANLTAGLLRVGRRREAHAVGIEAAALGRPLGEANIDASDVLAVVLINLGSAQHEIGKHAAALATAQESVALCRRRVSAGSEAGRARLTSALLHLGLRQGAVARAPRGWRR